MRAARAYRRVAASGLALLAIGCRQDMHDQAKYKPFRRSAYFADGRAMRPLVEGTVARNEIDATSGFASGLGADGPLVRSPVATTPAVLERGRERYDIFCSPCHDRTGRGEGMIVRRGLRRPPSFHETRLREAVDGYFVDVMVKGFGAMSSYAAQIPAADRWAIVAYIRALQLSQHATIADVPGPERSSLETVR